MEKNVVLAFDTSTENLAVALWHLETDEKWTFSEVSPKGHASSLHTTIADLLEKSGLSLEQVKLIVITKGPGSFTGARLAFAAANGFKQALGAPLFTVTTLEVIAQAHQHRGQDMTVWVNSHGGMVYQQQFTADAQEVDSPTVVKPHEIISTIDASSMICGSGALYYGDILPEGVAVTEDAYVKPEILATYGYQKWQQEGDQKNPAPLYLHPLTYRKVGQK